MYDEPASCKQAVVAFLRNITSSLTEEQEQRIRQAFANETDQVLVVGSNSTVCQFHNFVAHAAALGAKSSIVHAALDASAQQACEKRRSQGGLQLTCLDLSDWLPLQDDSFPGAVTYESCLWYEMVWTKPFLLWKAVQATPQNVLLLDLDMVLHGDVLAYCREHRQSASKLLFAREDGGTFNSGTLFANRASARFLETWISHAGAALVGTQMALTNTMTSARWISESIQIIPRDIIGQCGLKGQLATHFNCVDDKISRMKEVHMWAPGVEGC